MGTPSPRGLLSALRTRLVDTNPSVDAFTLSMAEGAARSALLELSQGILRVTVTEPQGPTRGLNLSLSDPHYDTVGKLLQKLQASAGYLAAPVVGAALSRAAQDLVADGALVDIIRQVVTFRHFRFTDEELTSLLEEACTSHNANYTLMKVPASEHHYVLMKAQAGAYRMLATDSAKRVGLAESAELYLELARDTETQYRADIKQNARILPAVKADTNRVGAGDVVVGVLSRPSARFGYTSPLREAPPSEPLKLLDPTDGDVEDTLVRLRWEQQRSSQYAFVEVWRDTQPSVERSLSGRSPSANGLPAQSIYSKASSSMQVLGMRGAATSSQPAVDGFFFWTLTEGSAYALVNCTFTDGLISPDAAVAVANATALGAPLEPDTDYYYRAYVGDTNGELQPSRVIKVRTLPLRGRFSRDSGGGFAGDAVSPRIGPLAGGTSVTLKGTQFVAGTQVLVGGKAAAITSLSATQIVITTPGMLNPQFVGRGLDLIIVSPSGLKDVYQQAWSYT